MGTTISVPDSTTGGTDQFTFQSTGTSNALFTNRAANGPTSSTFTLNAPANYNDISLLAAAGNGPASINATFYFVGGGTSSASLSVSDWFNGSSLAYTSSGRITGNNGADTYDNQGGTNPRVYYYDLTNVPITLGNLQQIVFSYPGTGNSSTAIFASATLWTGSTSNVWSLASSDTNWSTPSQAYADGAIVGFNNTGSNSNINIAVSCSRVSCSSTTARFPTVSPGRRLREPLR
jgi:hypothetical protein